MKTKILISGAGVAGLVAAIKLDRSKFEVTLVQRSDDFNSKGYAVMIWDSGIKILQELFDEDPDWLNPIDRMDVVAGSDHKSYRSINMKGKARSVKRHDLITNLSSLYKSRYPHDKVVFNEYITAAKDGKAKLKSGKTLDYDLIICAEGANSELRDMYFKADVRDYAYSVKYQWLANPGGMRDGATVFISETHTGIIYTTGKDTIMGYYNNGSSVSDAVFEAGLASYLDDKFGGSVKFNSETARYFPNKVVKVNRPYINDVVLIGDAYHCQPPTVAFGTTAAIEDSVTLAAALGDKDTIAQALEAYTELRTKRVKELYRYQDRLQRFAITSSKARLMAAGIIGKLFAARYFEAKLKSLGKKRIEYRKGT